MVMNTIWIIIIIIYIPYILLSVIHLIIVCAAGTLCAQDRMVWYLYEIQSDDVMI